MTVLHVMVRKRIRGLCWVKWLTSSSTQVGKSLFLFYLCASLSPCFWQSASLSRPLSLAHKHSEDVSASLQGSSPNVKSIVLSLPSGDRIASTHTHFIYIYTYTGAQVVCCSGLTHTVLNMMQHCSSRQQRLTVEKNKPDIKNRRCFKKIRGPLLWENKVKKKKKGLQCCEVNPQIMFSCVVFSFCGTEVCCLVMRALI